MGATGSRGEWRKAVDLVQTEVLRAFRFTLDPTRAQQEDLLRHAGAARWAFNHALGMKIAAHQQWRDQVQALVDSGPPVPAAALPPVLGPRPTDLVGTAGLAERFSGEPLPPGG
ncbi:helix-turn-helix domain-containing protein [Streptomyces arboris]|uniref:helix-turn-helix domain-containing protein n=1 Tax=Streptomyces arboris TaxID=2600619 RepID=UPI00178C2481|nr:helix-turn-helix domain-containing protein [Streptomyces arboris]